MNYKKLYNTIIENRKQNELEGYTENHHIIPRSLGGTDTEENLVKLTAREHFICHYLLAKVYPKESFEWHKMNHAFMIMKCDNKSRNKRYFNSRLYESLKGNFSLVMSELQSGVGNSQYGTMWICNIELEQNKKIKKIDSIPEGWIKGRNKWNIKSKKVKHILLDQHIKDFKKKKLNRKIKYEQHVKDFKKNQNFLKTEIILNFIEANNIESIAKLLRMGYYTDYKYPQKLTNYLKRYNIERFRQLIKPKFYGKTTNRK